MARKSLQTKVALVTGGARRVGRAVALTLAQAGMDVAITYHRSSREAKQLVQQVRRLGREGEAIPADATEIGAADTIFKVFSQRFTRLDALINNASAFRRSSIGHITPEAYDQDMAVNARFPLLLIQAFAPMLSEHYQSNDPSSTGRVVNLIDSRIMKQPLSGYVSYSASKAALMEITMTCALELAPQVTVNGVAPGAVEWPPHYSDRMKRAYLSRVPLARAGSANDAASVVLFLVKDAHYCTGQILSVDGGRYLT